MKYIDYFIDRITMYRLVLYYLIVLVVIAEVFCFVHILPYSPIDFFFTTSILLIISYVVQKIFAYVYEAPANVESVYISALILALLIAPVQHFSLPFLGWAAVLMVASKFILAIHNKHIFNPVAFAIFMTATFLGQPATWWVGTAAMMPFVVIGGLLIMRKIRREDLVLSFLITAAITVSVFGLMHGTDLLVTLKKVALDSSLFFLGFVMLTEPLTTPPTRNLRILYGILVGFLFAPQIHLGSFYTTPEIALLIGNIFSYVVSPKSKLLLRLQEKVESGANMVDFIFKPAQKFAFTPGQYMEWTLQHPHTDSRGNRRYFTLASSPTEQNIHLGIRFSENGSSFKKAMNAMDGKLLMVGGQLAGDFVLPQDKTKKLVFIAGGIGITPFRSMIKYLVDTSEKRDIVLLYSNKIAKDIMYKDVWDEAEKKLGIKTVYTVTDKNAVPQNWKGRVGRFDDSVIQQEIPDFKDRTFYISGPHEMVTGTENLLKSMGVPFPQIKIDFFPGLA